MSTPGGSSLPTLYRGSVKDVLGPVRDPRGAAVVFDYTDAYSVFDWGRMPDLLPRKGEALALIAAEWFDRLERAETWREFSKSPVAQSLRKGNRFGAGFNELGEKLQNEGLRTHYLGTGDGSAGAVGLDDLFAASRRPPVRQLLVRQVHVTKPAQAIVLSRAVPDYAATRSTPYPRLVPLEVVFRFRCPPGSSLLERIALDPGYLAERGFADAKPAPGAKWDFPVLELFSKLETTDRPLTLSEGLAISGLGAAQLQTLLLSTAWIAGYLKACCARAGLELADGKVEWGVDEGGRLFLVDAIGPDELRLLQGDVQLSKEFLRAFYRATPWYDAIGKAKKEATARGEAEWKRLVSAGPPPLGAAYRDLATQLYLALANALTGRKWFADAWELDRVVQGLRDATRGGGP